HARRPRMARPFCWCGPSAARAWRATALFLAEARKGRTTMPPDRDAAPGSGAGAPCDALQGDGRSALRQLDVEARGVAGLDQALLQRVAELEIGRDDLAVVEAVAAAAEVGAAAAGLAHE